MPIRESNTVPDLSADSVEFLIFYSSIVNGRLWCPDCVAVESLVKSHFDKEENSPSALIIYVGDRPTWKSPSNVFRGEPFHIQSVPTILKIQNGKEAGRLVDSEIAPGLADFIRS